MGTQEMLTFEVTLLHSPALTFVLGALGPVAVVLVAKLAWSFVVG